MCNLTYSDWGVIEANGAIISKVSNNVWGISKIANSSFVSIWITAKVNTNTSGIISNTVGVHCSEKPIFVINKSDITVVPINLNIVKSANPDNVIVSQNLTFTITVTNNALVTVTNINIVDILDNGFKFDGKSTNLKCALNNNKITWTVASLGKGESITIVFNVTAVKVGSFENIATVSCSENSSDKSSKTKVTINKAPSFVNAENVTVNYGESIVIGVTSVNATGVTYKIINQNNVVVSSGVLKPGEAISGLNLPAGKYTVDLTTNVDENHSSVNYKSSITVNPASSSVSAENVVVTYGEDILVRITSINATGVNYRVVDENNIVVASGVLKPGDVLKMILSASMNAILSDSPNNYNLRLDLPVGKYTINLATVVDDNYLSATSTSTITVNPATSSVEAENIVVNYGDDITVPVTSVNATQITYKIIDENNVVVSSGVLKPGDTISGLNLAVGKYTVNLTTVVDTNHTSSIGTSTITVNKALSSVEGEDVTVYVGDEITVIVSSVNAREITYNIVDKDNNVVAEGVLKPGENIKLSGLPAGKYTVNYLTVVDENHISAKNSSNIVVEKILAPINVDAPPIRVGGDGVITVTVPEDATGTVTIEVGSKSYTAQVRDGKAVFIVPGLKAGLHNIKAYYSGDEKYLPNNSSAVSIDVLPADKPETETENKTVSEHNGPVKSSAEDNGSLAKYKTGNPIVVLLIVLSLLLGVNFRRRK